MSGEGEVERNEVEKDYFRESMEPLYGSDGGIRDTLRYGEDRISAKPKQPNETSVGSLRNQARNSVYGTIFKEESDGTADRIRKQKELEYKWKRVGCGTEAEAAVRCWDYHKKTSFLVEFYQKFDYNKLADYKYIEYMTYWGVRERCLERLGFLPDPNAPK